MEGLLCMCIVHDDFAFNEINENLPITHTSTLFQSLFVEVWRNNIIYKKYVIGNIYRLPSYISDDVYHLLTNLQLCSIA